MKKLLATFWLYNQIDPDENYQWTDSAIMPFLNKREFIRSALVRPKSIREFRVQWISSPAAAIAADLYLGEVLFAKISREKSPGWCINAVKDGPLAKTFDMPVPHE